MSKTYGLVVCGGKSTRMGMDKSMLNYHGQPQRYHLYDMLAGLCEKVFISCNEEQQKSIPDKYAVMVDAPEYAEIGPMAAILTAFKNEPDADFLVIGCDYPLVNIKHLEQLIKVKHKSIYVVCYQQNRSTFYEPLLCVYQSIIKTKLEYQFKQNNYSIQSVFREINAYVIHSENNIEIKSIDTIEEYEKMMIQLRLNK